MGDCRAIVVLGTTVRYTLTCNTHLCIGCMRGVLNTNIYIRYNMRISFGGSRHDTLVVT